MIDESVISAINFFLMVALYSLSLASPLIILILLMAGYEKYKKWQAKEVRELDKIIVKKNKQMKEDALACDTLKSSKTQLQLDVEALRKEKKSLSAELGKPDEVEVPEDADIKQLNIKELKALAKDRGIKRYSKMNKESLLEALGN